MNDVDATVVRSAATSLGWEGTPVRVRWAGENAWAIASWALNLPATSGASIRIAGVMVTGSTRNRPTQRASVFAGYCRRAVVIPEGRGVLPVQMEAAVLDQGVVVVGPDGTRMLSAPGAVQPGASDSEASARGAFAEHVYAALIAAGAVGSDRG